MQIRIPSRDDKNCAFDIPCVTKKRNQGEDNASALISDQAPIYYMVKEDFHLKLMVTKNSFRGPMVLTRFVEVTETPFKWTSKYSLPFFFV